jgi:hypothetical protein
MSTPPVLSVCYCLHELDRKGPSVLPCTSKEGHLVQPQGKPVSAWNSQIAPPPLSRQIRKPKYFGLHFGIIVLTRWWSIREISLSKERFRVVRDSLAPIKNARADSGIPNSVYHHATESILSQWSGVVHPSQWKGRWLSLTV